MQFKTDEQTMSDLSITVQSAQKSVAGLFKPVCVGAQALLMQMLTRPLANAQMLQNRLQAIEFIQANGVYIKLNKQEVDFIEHYLRTGTKPNKASKIRAYKNAIKQRLSPSNGYYIISRGVNLLANLLKIVHELLKNAPSHNTPTFFAEYLSQVNELLNGSGFEVVKQFRGSFKPTEIEECDYLFRGTFLHEIKQILHIIYELDVYGAVAHTAEALCFTYPQILNHDGVTLELQNVFHPFVSEPVGNNISFDNMQHVCLITGSNMAGKSTLLKAVGIAVLLAHVGFPVPASSMKSSVFNGLFTTINLSDNIEVGHSHFYAEVLRIKQVAQHVGELEKIVVIFDELFRGTNVKDAYDASLAIIKALANVKGCIFIISTHIVEVADELNNIENLFFRCMQTSLQGTQAVYDYKLKDGVSAERLGMKIIEDEGIVALLQAQGEGVRNAESGIQI